MKAILLWMLVGTAAFTAAVPPASAHSGRTDASGCHTCRTNCSKYGLSNGQYHCHGGGRSSARPRTKPPAPASPPPPPSAPVLLFREGERAAGQLPENSIVVHRDPSSNRGPGVRVEALAAVDGDTFVAREGERLYLLTLRDLEAPELEQAYGSEARARLSEWMGRRIVVWPENGKGCVIPVEAETLGGTDVSRQLLSEGFAWASRSAPEDVRRLETAARLGRVGLWQGADPEPPWEYRARRTMAGEPQRP